MKPLYSIAQAYLNRATRNFALDDLAGARASFDKASRTKSKLKLKSVRDVSTANNGGIKLRIYRNDPANTKPPAVVYFHGGGFALGSIESHDSVCRSIGKYAHCVVVSVEYSLAPEATYPVPVNEGLAVLDWLERCGEEEGIDISKLFLGGDSAGGNIALSVATDSRLKTDLCGLVLLYPTLDPALTSQSMQRYATGHFLTKAMLHQFWSLYKGEQYHIPTDAELGRLPPVLLIAAEKDVLRDEGTAFAQKLRTLHKDVEYEVYSDMLHGFVQFPKIVSKKMQAFKRISMFVAKQSGQA
ncbi:MAG TPA: alpha/beta hydrolase [Candidatus Saccharimonadales bacterium]|nr:alpha/beta hydrolase [Candidatus Saccharimonadales bacterium]